MSVIPFERLTTMREAGLTPKDIKIIEDLTTFYLPYSRQCDPVDEAVHKWRDIKRMAADKARIEAEKNRQLAERSASIVRHGGIESMANGRIYTDKTAYRRDLQAQGFIEVGNEDTRKEAERVKKNITQDRRKQQEADVEAAVAQALKDVRI